MSAGRFTVGDVALFVAYIWPVTALFQNIGGLIANFQQTGVSIRRLGRLMRGAPDGQLVAPAPIYLTGPLPPLPQNHPTRSALAQLEISVLSYHHPNGEAGIQGINLQIPAGSLTVITGRVGSGKTTLLRAVLGLLPKRAGEIRWNGELVADPATFFVPPRSAYTSQTPRLFSESLRENILLGVDEGMRKVVLGEAITKAVLEQDIATMADGLETLVGPRGAHVCAAAGSAGL